MKLGDIKELVDIKVNFTVHLRKADLARLINLAHESGLDHGEDPGPKEVVRRLIIDEGISALRGEDGSIEVNYTVHK